MKGVIRNASLKRVDEVWKKHKPQGLGFSDTDVIIVEVKPEKGIIFTQNFYCRLKGDGSLGHSMTHASEKRQKSIIAFVRKYISKDKRYNVRRNIERWKGKNVEVEEINGGFSIKI